MLCVQGDIFITPADHIAFAVNYPKKDGTWANTGGFAKLVEERGWEGLSKIKFTKGESVSKKIGGKTYHAMAVHSNEPGGWDEAPELIHFCLNNLPVDSVEMVAIVLIGGGKSGEDFKANVKNIEGMSRTYKSIVLYVKEVEHYGLLLARGLAAAAIPFAPKTRKYRELAHS